tara:strand:- start:24781 stop:26457 length:1677 start_codon:yes stop_codon:yes gene_type:complete
MLLSSFAELMSLGAVIPFLSILSNPEAVWSNQSAYKIAYFLGYRDASELIFPITFIFVFTCFLASVIRLLSIWANGKYSASIGSDISILSYRKTLYQPFIVHVKRNSSEVINTITLQTARTTAGFTAFLQMTSSSLISLSLFVGFFVIDWKIALSAVILFSIVYSLIARFTSKKLKNNSAIVSSNSQFLIKVLQEGLGAIRDLLLDKSQQFFVETYAAADREQRLRLANNQFLASFPRYSLETLGIIFIALLGYSMLLEGNNPSFVLPFLGTIALGSQKLLPSLQQVYSSWAKLRGFQSDLLGVLTLLLQDEIQNTNKVKPLINFSDIVFNSVNFSYDSNNNFVNKSINIKINSNEIIGIIGETGSGKSTFIDLFMGLLEPTDGRILVNGKDLHNSSCGSLLDSWRASISHVPQNIYLTDTSFIENIAFGVPKKEIDHERVFHAAQQACIFDYIDSTPEGFNTLVGEKGVRMSGGQMQRIGIARALYKSSSIIVLDEATSALDMNTELAVMNNLTSQSFRSTFVIIAHRLSTLKNCDRIIKIENGAVVEDNSNFHIFD